MALHRPHRRSRCPFVPCWPGDPSCAARMRRAFHRVRREPAKCAASPAGRVRRTHADRAEHPQLEREVLRGVGRAAMQPPCHETASFASPFSIRELLCEASHTTTNGAKASRMRTDLMESEGTTAMLEASRASTARASVQEDLPRRCSSEHWHVAAHGTNDEAELRELIARWSKAVYQEDLT